MDADKLGAFIAERRKELGLTQSMLAQKLHVTDKAVSRWERGVGLPDINSIESLADALKVSLIELMQAQRSEDENISAKEAEKLLSDTIWLSKTTNKITKAVGGIILSGFAVIAVLLLFLLISDWNIVMYSVGSIITGLIAWGIPIWHISFARTRKVDLPMISSLGFALVSVAIQFYSIANEVHTGDWSAIMDTIDALRIVVVLFSLIAVLLNIIMAWLSKHKS